MKVIAELNINNGQFTSKLKMTRLEREIKIPVALPIRSFQILEPSPKIFTSPVMVFEWWKQVGKYTHVYKLRDIEL